MKHFYVLFLYTLASTVTNAQSPRPKPINRLSFFFAEQYYYEKFSVRTDGKKPDNILYPQNTFGKAMSIEYERITPSGFTYGGGLIYGTRNYDLLIKNDVSNFDPEAVNRLKGKYIETRQKGSINYKGLKLNAGYRKILDKNWALFCKTSFEARLLHDGSRAVSYIYYIYYDDNLNVKQQQMLSIINVYGRNPDFQKYTSFYRFIRSPSYGVLSTYIGAEYGNMPFSWVKKFSLGLEIGKGITFGDDNEAMIVRSRESINTSPTNLTEMSRDVFIDRNFYLGLRAGVSLWH